MALGGLNGRQREPPEQSGVILSQLHPAIPQSITPLLLRTLGAGQECGGHAGVVTLDRALMMRLAGPAAAERVRGLRGNNSLQAPRQIFLTIHRASSS
jgi:hypothetical protein